MSSTSTAAGPAGSEARGAPALDAVVVGAGPAGAAAALALALAGRSVVVLERGPFPGSKNVYGGVVYGRILDEVLPGWWEEVPVERWVVRRSTMVMTESSSLSFDYRSEAWGHPPYNGMTTHRADFDAWLAGKAVQAGARLITSTVATGLLRDAAGRVCGVRTDRPDGDLPARVVIACDGVNSFLGKEAGLLTARQQAHQAEHHTLGVKEVLALPPEVIDERFGLHRHEGLDIEILGGTRGIPGGGFLYTNAASVSVGAVLSLRYLAEAKVRPEEIVADIKGHPSIAPFLRGARLLEYSAHLIPEGGYDAMPALSTDGLMLAGDAAGMTLAAGIWLEGVNFAIGSGLTAGRVAARAVTAGDTSARGLSGYRRELAGSFVLADHKRLRGAPRVLLSERVQRRYPGLMADIAEGVFAVTNPEPKPGMLRVVRRAAKANGLRLTDLGMDALRMARVFR